MELTGKRIVLGVTGGIAAYKAAELVRLLGRTGAEVQVAMTEGATHFVTATTFQALSGRPVYLDQWDARMPNAMAHIDLSRQADLIVIAPASADFLARIANGMADDLLATMVLARDCPLLVAPAMNRQMWENPATQRNVRQLSEDGVAFIGPASGEQACGEVGAGRMVEPEDIVEAVIAHFAPKCLAGRKVLITAGPTFEAIDPVRGITNLSSGRMGYAVARAARQAGAEVTLVSGPVAFSPPQGVDRINVRSALDMHAAVLARAADSDIFIAVAAVADYRVANAAEHKLKKDHGGVPAIELVENPDILAEIAALPEGPFCVGFAAESRNLDDYAQAKRRKKNIPLIAGNLIQDGFGGDDNRLVLFDDAGSHPLTPAPKAVLARQLIEHIAKLTGNR
ncbi:MAG: bifunctional phosphopantothenoylcysteine decarboxylase/phosphopantothenate--cysteine ligase CoaBC [Azonexaceae bacterium]|nr:bifunctional phosphopantothenoylcysteine decarboxylase/phosphopantothenate--cysteine ligase CoaBC [Azonexaceae bacterium]